MEPHWASYFYNVNGKLASIFLDIALQAPDLGRPWLLWIWVYFKQPRPDGLSSSEEFPTLCAIEDKLNALMQQHGRASLAGRITTDGRREFYYYAPRNSGVELALAEVAEAFGTYEFDSGTQHDPNWNQYLNVLYPPREELQRITNREVLDLMQEQGDQPDSPREVTHWSYFKTAEGRTRF